MSRQIIGTVDTMKQAKKLVLQLERGAFGSDQITVLRTETRARFGSLLDQQERPGRGALGGAITGAIVGAMFGLVGTTALAWPAGAHVVHASSIAWSFVATGVGAIGGSLVGVAFGHLDRMPVRGRTIVVAVETPSATRIAEARAAFAACGAENVVLHGA